MFDLLAQPQLIESLEILAPASLLGLLIKACIVCACGLYILGELSFLSASARHGIALGTLFCLALLPLLGVLGVTWQLPILPAQGVESDSVRFLPQLIVLAYVAVCLCLLLRLIADIAGALLLATRAVSVGPASQLLPALDHPHAITPVAMSAQIRTPLTCGWLRPIVMLPQGSTQWCEEELSMVFQHELTHVERGDWWVQLFGRLMHAVYWPVPGISQLLRHLSLSAEQACDDRVLASGAAPAAYAAMLLRQARGIHIPATVPLAHGAELGVRVRYLFEDFVDHSVPAPGKRLTLLICFALTAPLATLQLGLRPELPSLPWGTAAPSQATVHPVLEPHQIGISALTRQALRPGPRRPERPAPVVAPPRIDSQEKPTIPPPAG